MTRDSVIETQADTVVGRPIPRETIRNTSEGYLVTCTDMRCPWQGLFYDRDLAAEAVEQHYDHERRNGTYHRGRRSYTVVELVDDRTACTLDESSLGLSVEENRYCTMDGGVREAQFPRTTEDVPELVSRGDEIRLPSDRLGKVVRVTETRSLGLPTWTVVYVAPEVELLEAQPKQDYRWLNELIAQDGEAYQSFGPNPLDSPAFEIAGETEHQSALEQFGGGAKAR